MIAAPEDLEQARRGVASRSRARPGAHDRLRRAAHAFRCLPEGPRARTHRGADRRPTRTAAERDGTAIGSHHRALARRSRRLLAREGRARSTGTRRSTTVLDYSPAAVRALVRRRHARTSATTRSIATSTRAATRMRWSTSPPRRARRARYTYRELARRGEPLRGDAARASGVGKGDRVLIYMPMIPEAVFAMLACARIGAVHSVVFGGFAAASLAHAHRRRAAEGDGHRRRRHARRQGGALQAPGRRGDAARAATAGARGHRRSRARPRHAAHGGPRPRLRRRCASEHAGAQVPCEWLESSEPSYILYTSGTTGKPKGVQRDTGGYAVALAASMRDIFCVAARRDDVHHQRHRLGGGPLVHRLRPAASTARRRSCTRACRSVPTRRSGGRSWRSTR